MSNRKSTSFSFCLIFITGVLFLSGGYTVFARAAPGPDIKTAYSKDKFSKDKLSDSRVEIYADKLQYFPKTSLYHAEGMVDIKRELYRLRADKVDLNDETGKILATGNVVIDDSENRVTAQRAEYNLHTDTGTFYQAEVFLSPTYYITGAVIRKISENVYELEDGTYTSCSQPTPDWQFKVGHARVVVNHKAYLTNNTLFMKWLPVFYIPYTEVPLKRSSGFLLPQTGTTNYLGRYMRNSFFVNIADWIDTTLIYDYTEKKGNGYGMESSYALTENSKFIGTGYYIKEKDTELERWEKHINMTQELPLGFTTILRLDDYSDRDYNKDYLFGNNVLTGNYARWQQEQISYFSLTRNWENFRFNTIIENRKNLANFPITRDDDDPLASTSVNVTSNNYDVWRYPEITFTALPQKIFGTPLSFKGSASYLEYEKNTVDETVTREEKEPVSRTTKAIKNKRYNFRPELFLPLKPVPWFSVTPSVGADYTEWDKNKWGIKTIEELEGEVIDPEEPVPESKRMYRKYIFYSAETYGPEVYRNFDAHSYFGVDYIKHSIFPTVTYTRVPLLQYNLREDVISFDGIDNNSEVENINYQLTQNLLGKFLDKRVRQLVTLTIGQSYNWVEKRKWLKNERRKEELEVTIPSKPLRPYSPVKLQLKTQLFDGFNLDWDMDYDIYHEITTSTNLLARARYNKKINILVGWRSQRTITEPLVYDENGENPRYDRYDVLTESVNLSGDILFFNHLKVDASLIYKIADTEIKWTNNQDLRKKILKEKRLRKKLNTEDGMIQPLDFMIKLSWLSQCWSVGVSYRRTYSSIDPINITADSEIEDIAEPKKPFQEIILFYFNLYSLSGQAF